MASPSLLVERPSAFRNYLAGRGAAQDEETQSVRNALYRHQVERLPQQNRAEDLAIQQTEQQLNANDLAVSDSQKATASQLLAQRFAAVAQSASPKIAARQFLGDPNFRAAGTLLGLPIDQFSVTDQDTDEQLRASALDWARALGAQPDGDGNAALDTFGAMTKGLPEADVDRARRINLGLEPRAVETNGPQPPSGYQWKEGGLEPVPGGPADPAGPQARRNSMQLRKEFEDQEPVKTYRSVLPLYQRAATAPDSRAGDISVIYALGKMFDPTSVVREGELQLSMTAAPWLQRIAAGINSQITGEGRLTPKMRTDILQSLHGQVDALRAPYEQERQRYSGYATDSGFDANSVVGPNPADAFPQPAQSQPSQPEVTATGPNGEKIVLRNGQWVPM